MSQHTAFGQAELTSYMKVDRKNGGVTYFKIIDGENIEVTEAEYLAAHKEN